MRKREMFCSDKNDLNRLWIYMLNQDDLKGESRPKHLLCTELEEYFFDHMPKKDEGDCLNNKDAGILPSNKDKKLNYN